MTLEQAQRRLASAERRFRTESAVVARRIATRIGARATSKFMRTDDIGPRKKDDTGPLRKQTGDLAKAIRGGSGTFGAVEKVYTTGFRTRLEKGVDEDDIPYAAVHEYGIRYSRLIDRATIVIPKRPYLRPAILIERRKMAAQEGTYLKNVVLSELRKPT